jgi:hypothetical protein
MSMEKLKDSIKLLLSDPRGGIKRPFVTMGLKDQMRWAYRKAHRDRINNLALK